MNKKIMKKNNEKNVFNQKISTFLLDEQCVKISMKAKKKHTQ